MAKYPFRPLDEYIEYPPEEMLQRSEQFYQLIKRRRTVREFYNRPVSREIIENCLKSAGTAPSGANMQPWRFVVVSDPEIKKQIREKAEEVEKDFYTRRAPEYWLKALEPLGTDEHKEYMEKAPYLIVIFTVRHGYHDDGSRQNHYYLSESVGIATGMLLTALHNAGLATLTHTPSPMAFLRDILQRPKEETPFMVVVAGYPDENAQVPEITKKPLDEIATFI